MMKRSTDLASFLVDTGDRCFWAEEYIAWRVEPDLLGVVHWDEQYGPSLDERARVLDRLLDTKLGRQRVLVDSRYGASVSPSMYAAVVDFWMSRRERHSRTIAKLAVLVPQGFVGAVITGLSVLFDLGCPLALFTDLESALEWLGAAEQPSLSEQLRQLRPPLRHSGLLTALHALLTEANFAVGVRQAARRLGMSERTLQRRLSEAQTTFKAELSSAKFAQAKLLMLKGARNMTTIALELGFASVQHFSARFSALHGEPPSSWLRGHLDDQLKARIASVRAT